MRVAGESDAFPCDRLAHVWSTVLTSRDRSTYASLALPLQAAVKRCPKELDATLATSLAADVQSQTLAVMSIEPTDASKTKLGRTCAAIGNVALGSANAPTKARAAEIAARCR